MFIKPMTAFAVALAMATGSAFAQAEEEDVAVAAPPQESLIVEQEPEQMLSADLIGAPVMHPEHGKIGSLDSLLFDQDDRIVGGVVAIGGFLGLGTKQVALSWDEFDANTEDREVYIVLTQEQLEAAPAFKDLALLRAEEEAEIARQEMENTRQQQQVPMQQQQIPMQPDNQNPLPE